VNKIILGDCFEAIKKIEDGTVDLCLTSPPYADVKSYGRGVKILHPDEYVDWLLPLMKEIHRVLKPTGSLILNINDRIVNKQRHIYVHDLIVRAVRETSLKLYDTYIWVKSGTLPTGNHRRLNDWKEYLIHFCKNEDIVKWNLDAVREPHSPNTIKRCKSPVGAFKLNVDGDGKATGRSRKIIQLNEKGKIPCNVFTFPTSAAIKGKIHPAAFNIDLPIWFIKALTDEGDVVADVFAGSGTTCLAAKMLNRRFIGIEISPVYHEDAVRRIEMPLLAKAA
jgi:DNA modification methylase